MLEIVAREQPVRPAAVLIPVVDHPQPTVLLTQRAAASQRSRRPDFLSRRQDRRDRCFAARHRVARGRGGDRPRSREFVEPIGYLDLYGTGFGFRILPTVARVKPGFKLTHQQVRGRRRLRGAAGVPDEPREPSGPQQGISRHGALLLRHAVRRALHLGRDRGHSARAVRADLSAHDPSGSHRNRDFPDPVRGLCAVSDRDPLRTAGAVVMAGASSSPNWCWARCCW